MRRRTPAARSARAPGVAAVALAVAACGAGGGPVLPTVSVPDSAAEAPSVAAAPSLAASASPVPDAPAAATPSPVAEAPVPVPAATDPVAGPGEAPAAAPAGPAPGNGGAAALPPEARRVDTSRPATVVGDGTPAGCTSAAVVAAVARGGVVTFACGPAPVTITLDQTATVVNAAAPEVVLDGGGLVTLSGGGKRRILYMNTCDEAQGWTTAHCDDQDHPRLTVQDIGFADGDATGSGPDVGGGGAIFARGGRLTVIGSTFTGNRCDPTGPDVGGAAIRALDQSQDLPVVVASSTFTGGRCSNGGALSSIGVSWTVVDSVFTGNEAIGSGANPAEPGTPGGGSGGAIYADGNRFAIRLAGTRIEGNRAAEGGGAVFFVSNDRTGTMAIEDSVLRGNPSAGFETDGFPGIFFLGASPPALARSVLG